VNRSIIVPHFGHGGKGSASMPCGFRFTIFRLMNLPVVSELWCRVAHIVESEKMKRAQPAPCLQPLRSPSLAVEPATDRACSTEQSSAEQGDAGRFGDGRAGRCLTYDRTAGHLPPGAAAIAIPAAVSIDAD
jgi:hypothetical protein